MGKKLFPRSRIGPLRPCFYPSGRGVIATVVIARWIVLYKGTTIVLVYGWEQDLIHPDAEIIV